MVSSGIRIQLEVSLIDGGEAEADEVCFSRQSFWILDEA
jgi:hypothetical protein